MRAVLEWIAARNRASAAPLLEAYPHRFEGVCPACRGRARVIGTKRRVRYLACRLCGWKGKQRR